MTPLIPLDAAYEAINARGGVPSADPFIRGYCAAIGDALCDLEAFGAMDPCDSRIHELEAGILAAFMAEREDERRAA